MKYFLNRLGLTEYEFTRVKIAWMFRGLYQLGWVVAWTIVTALFVESFGIGSLLYLFLLEAILYFISSILASFVCQRCSLSHYVYGLIGGVLLSLGLACIVGAADKELFFLFILIAKSFFFTQLSIALYRRNEELFSPSEAIRLMPIVESSVTIGGLIGALLMVAGLSLFDPTQVLILWVVGLLGIAGITFTLPTLLHILPQWHKMEEEKPVQSWVSEVNGALKELPFVRYIALGIFIQAAIFTFFDVELTREVQLEVQKHAQHEEHVDISFDSSALQASVFKTVAESAKEAVHHTKEAVEMASTKVIMHETIAHDLGMLHLMFAMIAVVFQFFITPRVLSRLGVVGSWMSYGVFLFLSMVGMFVGSIPITLASAFRHGTHSLGESAYHISFYSLSGERREAVRLFLEGIVKPLGVATMIALLFLFNAHTVLLGGSVLLLGTFALWNPMRKAFTHISKRNIRGHKNLEEKLHSIEVLGQKGHISSSAILVQELRDMESHDLVRQKIIATLTRIQDPEVLFSYIEILNNESEEHEMKVQVLDSLLKLEVLKEYLDEHAFGQHHLLQTLKTLFHETDHSHLKKLVVMNIFRHMPAKEVVPFFLNTIAHADEQLQSIYLRSSKVFADPGIRHYLQPYLVSDISRIKGHAVIALWNFDERYRLRSVLHDLARLKDEASIIASLYAIGEVQDMKSKDLVERYVGHENDVVRLHAHVALAKLGDDSCVHVIVESIVSGNPRLTQMALGMIDRVDVAMRDRIMQEMKSRVSKQVVAILHPQNIRSVNDLRALKKGMLHELKRLYKLVGQFDDLLAMEKHSV